MIYTEAKEKIEALLNEAKAKLEPLGLNLSLETELVENQISETESEPLMIIGSVALTMDGLTEDDTYYVSIEATVEGTEVSDESLEEATPKFLDRIEAVYERLSAAEDKTATLIEMGKEVDEELERLYEEEVARNERAMKRDLKLAIIGTAAIVGAVVIALILSAIL